MTTAQIALRVIALHESGVPSSEVARRLHMPRKQVNHIIKNHLRRKERNDAQVSA